MDSDHDLLNAANAREEVRKAAEFKLKQRYEGAAKEAHKIRQMYRVEQCGDARGWYELPIGSQRHLIADAENVAANQNITAAELLGLYKKRLVAWGDFDSADLKGPGTEEAHETEDQVLRCLKKVLAFTSPKSLSN